MKKLLVEFIRVIIAALLALVGFTAFSIIIAAVLNDAENPIVQNILLALICTAAFVIGMLYVKKIRNEEGNYEFFEDYKTEHYVSLKDDLHKVLRNEKWTLIFIAVISIFCYIINIFWFVVLGNTIAFPITFSMVAMTSFQIIFPINSAGPVLYLFGYLISIAVDIISYISAVLLYRKRLYDKRVMH